MTREEPNSAGGAGNAWRVSSDKQRSEVRRLNAKRRRLQGKTSNLDAYPRTMTPRLTVSEVARTLLNRTPREMSHVGLSRGTSGGNIGIEVVVYVGESEDAATVEAAKQRCQSAFDELEMLYPRLDKGDKLEAQLRDSVAELKRKRRKSK